MLFKHATITLLFIVAQLKASPLNANEIYKSEGPNGEVIFTDAPNGEAMEKIEIEEVNVQPPIQPQRTQLTKPKPAPISRYSVKILSPSNNTTLTPGERHLMVSFDIQPQMRRGHIAQLLLNGKAHSGPSTDNTFTVQSITRGQYSVKVAVVENTGKVLAQSEAVTVNVIRAGAN